MIDQLRRKLRIGILSFAHMHAVSYAQELADRADVDLVGIWDGDENRGAERAKTFKTSYYPDLDELLSQGLDGVVVASENINHLPLVRSAAAAGLKAILCEKPLATNARDANLMVRICEELGVRLATAFPCRHAPAFRRLREQILAGAAGELLAIRGTNRGSMPGGWFVDPEHSGGGAVMDHTPHVADLIWLLTGKEATTVYAESGTGFTGGEVDDTGFLTISYGTELFATLDTSWSRPKTYPTWGDVTLQVVGTLGVFDLDLFGQRLEHYDDGMNNASWEYWGSSLDRGLIAEFVNLCAGLEASEIASGVDGLRAVALTDAAYRSIDLKEPVTVFITPTVPTS